MNVASLSRFPHEILWEIAASASRKDHIALCTVSKIFNSAATQFIYRHIELTSFKHVVQCCTTLSKRAEAALCVRFLSLDFHMMMKDTLDIAMIAPFLRLVNAALLRAKYLRSLVLRLPPDPHGAALDRCEFQLLNHYGSCFDGVSDFLKRHPSIKNITILGEKPTFLLDTAHIPLLEVFSGPAHSVPNIVPGRPVHSVKLWWPQRPWQSKISDAPDGWYSTEAVINCLARSTFEDGIVRAENLFWDWPPRQTLSALATSLTLRFLFIWSRNYAESAYDTVSHNHRTLPSLHEFISSI
ncbi:hypothetical protein C8R47DRAFT_996270 [Mycena vitilis]|nr:hypothetical protein C8R47DRAFT_996270 [Mycena vitilis]